MSKRLKSNSDTRTKCSKQLPETGGEERSALKTENEFTFFDSSIGASSFDHDSNFPDSRDAKAGHGLQDDDILNNASVCSTCFLAACDCSRQDFFSQLEGLSSFETEAEEQTASDTKVAIKDSPENLFSKAFAKIQSFSKRSDNSTLETTAVQLEEPEDKSLSSSPEDSGQFPCKDCLTRFKTVAKLKYHRLKVHGKWKTGVQCEICSKMFGTDSNRRRHLRTAHKAGPLVKQEPTSEDIKGPKSSASRVQDCVSEPKQCPQCSYSTFDLYHLKIHMRKHSGERPFECERCSFGFYKKSDLTLHFKSCNGVKHQCSQCQEVFHFKKQLQEHEIWSKTCGKIPNDGTNWSLVKEPGKRYFENKPAMVRLNVSTDKSIVVVNVENLIEKSTLVRRKNKARCGLCSGCERDVNCGTCNGCIKRYTCDHRRCLNRLVHFDLKTGEI